MTEPTPVDDMPYAAALAELEAILDRLERSDPDVDRIAVDVARAAELVRHCRSRIDSARMSVDSVIAELASAENRDAPEGL